MSILFNYIYYYTTSSSNNKMSTSDTNLLLEPSKEYALEELFRSRSNIPETEADDNNKIPSDLSILTRLTQDKSDVKLDRDAICLYVWEESNSQIIENDAFNFPPNKNPNIEKYIEIVENDNYKGWERYCRECQKYSMPRIKVVKDILDGKTTIFNMKVS